MRWLLPCFLACSSGTYAVDAEVPKGGDASDEQGPTGPPKIATGIVSGYAFDGRTGKPLSAVSVTTEPPLEAVTTNQSGGYAINAGQAFGRLTVRATRDGYVQRDVACVTLKPGRSVIADLTLVAPADDATPCQPACDATTECVSGVCVTRCNPPCGCGDRCTAAGACEPDPDAPSAGTCGANAIALGAGVCECEAGRVPSGDGRSCTVPPQDEGSCPPGASRTPSGSCACAGGSIPNALGDACVPVDELAVVTPLAGVQVGDHVAVRPDAPRGLALHEGQLWLGYAGVLTVERLDGQSVWPLGLDGARLVDLASGPQGLWLVLDGQGSDRPTLSLLDPVTGVVQALGANDFDASPGIAFDGARLASLEGSRLVRRSADLAQLVAFSTLELTDPPDLSVTPPSLGSFNAPAVAFLALTGNRALAWEGSVFDGSRWLTALAVLNAAHPTRSARVDTLFLDLGASHVRGLEATGTRGWVLVDGAGVADGPALPAVVELDLE